MVCLGRRSPVLRSNFLKGSLNVRIPLVSSLQSKSEKVVSICVVVQRLLGGVTTSDESQRTNYNLFLKIEKTKIFDTINDDDSDDFRNTDPPIHQDTKSSEEKRN